MNWIAVGDSIIIKRVMDELELCLSENAERITRFVGVPSSPSVERELMWHESIKLWAYIKRADNKEQYWCVYGTSIKDQRVLSPSVEINPPTDGCNLRLSGVIVKNEFDDYYLAHKGGLRGGKNNVTIDEFVSLYHGGERETIVMPDGRRKLFYVIGKIGDLHFLRDLQHFVSESERIRGLASRNRSAQ